MSFFGDLREMADAIKVTAEAVDAVVNTLDENATRSVVLDISNTTNRTLILQGEGHLDHGIFREPPPFEIPPRTNRLFTAQSSGFATGTEGNVQYRLNDDGGTIFHLDWVNPFIGGNESSCRVEGVQGSQYITAKVTGGGNTKVQMRYLLGARVDAGPRQPDWMTCGNCKLLFFAPHTSESNCPAGGNHSAAGANIHLPHGEPGPNHQPNWQTCGKCQSLFFNGDPIRKGVCSERSLASHEAAGTVFLLPHSRGEDATHQSGWRHCVKCSVLFFEPHAADSKCPADGGIHVAHPESLTFQLPHSIPEDATHQTRWMTCGKCKTMFFEGQAGDSNCPADGGTHSAAGVVFALPHGSSEPGAHQSDWRTCHKCKSIFFDGDPNSKGVCPDVDQFRHQAAGLVFHLPFDVPEPGQDKWRFCRECFGLFFEPHNADGHCAAGGNHQFQGFNFRLDARP
jgi:hypothetical protein